MCACPCWVGNKKKGLLAGKLFCDGFKFSEANVLQPSSYLLRFRLKCKEFELEIMVCVKRFMGLLKISKYSVLSENYFSYSNIPKFSV